MKQICLQCLQQSRDSNLWCAERFCPVENMPFLFEPGEWFGDIEILKIFVVLRTAVIYTAMRGGKKIFLKISHKGNEHRLKAEAEFLIKVQKHRRMLPYFPTLLPAREDGSLKNNYLGLRYLNRKWTFIVFDYIEGSLLATRLAKNSQPKLKEVGWITLGLTDAIGFMHQQNRLHGVLNPNMLLIHTNKEKITTPIILDLGYLWKNRTREQFALDNSLQQPAYTAPELANRRKHISASIDVYGIGLILFEMLAGHPGYSDTLRSEREVFGEINSSPPLRLQKNNAHPIEAITKALSKNPKQRQKSIPIFYRQLKKYFRPIPRSNDEHRKELLTVLLGAIGLIFIIAFVTLQFA